MSSPAKVMVAYLVLRGLGRLPPPGPPTDWYVYDAKEPAKEPDSSITVFDAGSVPQFGRMRGGRWRGNPALQIRFRHRDYQTGYSKGQDIMDALSELRNTPVGVAGDVTAWMIDRFTPDFDGEPRWVMELEHHALQVFVINGTVTLEGREM